MINKEINTYFYTLKNFFGNAAIFNFILFYFYLILIDLVIVLLCLVFNILVFLLLSYIALLKHTISIEKGKLGIM